MYHFQLHKQRNLTTQCDEFFINQGICYLVRLPECKSIVAFGFLRGSYVYVCLGAGQGTHNFMGQHY